jgi:Zn-dependent peptidase ImmA (M78 family)
MPRVNIAGTVLRWALERSGKDAAVLTQRLPKLSNWLKGEGQPTLRQLEDFARATSTPLGYLFLTHPPEEQLPIPYFRTLDNAHPPRLSPDLLESVYTMQRRQEWMREYLIDQGQEPLSFVGSARPDDDFRRIAGNMRQALAFEQGWAAEHSTWTDALADLRKRLEATRVLVVVNAIVGNNTHRKLDPEEFRGFVLVDEYAPLVFVNGADAKAAQMFTLAHEFAHLWFGSSAAFDLRELRPADNDNELACNRTAAEFLVPEDELRKFWPSARKEPETFQAIARYFKVSELVAARRAQDLGFINRREYHEFYLRYLQSERPRTDKKSSGGNFYASQNLRVGRRFGQAVVRASREGKLLYRDAYQLTGLSGGAFDRYAESLGAGGVE